MSEATPNTGGGAGAQAALSQEILAEIESEFDELNAEIERINALPAEEFAQKQALLEDLRSRWAARTLTDPSRPEWRQRIDRTLHKAVEEILDDQVIDADGQLQVRFDQELLKKHGPAFMAAAAEGMREAFAKRGFNVSAPSARGADGKVDPQKAAQALFQTLIQGLGTMIQAKFGEVVGGVVSGVAKAQARPAKAEAAPETDAEAAPNAEAAPQEAESDAEPAPEPPSDAEEAPKKQAPQMKLNVDVGGLLGGIFQQVMAGVAQAAQKGATGKGGKINIDFGGGSTPNVTITPAEEPSDSEGETDGDAETAPPEPDDGEKAP